MRHRRLVLRTWSGPDLPSRYNQGRSRAPHFPGGLQMRVPAAALALPLPRLRPKAVARRARAEEQLWKESRGASAPADIAGLNDFMNDLAERLKPPLVQIRVRRAAEPQAEGPEQHPNPNAPDERR